MNVIETIKQRNLGKYRLSGDQVEINCPFEDCDNVKTPAFYISTKNGAWMCHKCGKKGSNLKQLEFKLGFIKLQDPVKTSHIYIPEKDITRWSRDLFKNSKALQYLKEQRGFEDWILKYFKLGFKMYDNKPCIVIPYYDKTDTCVGAKYDFFLRTEGPKYMKEKGSKSIFFNVNNLEPSQPLTITEGEYDAMAGYQLGIENIGSVPNGAQGINGWLEDIASFSTYRLCCDNDSAGQEGAEKLAEALGKSKCFRVFPRVKDLSDALQIGLSSEEVAKWFEDKEPMFQAPITDITSYIDKAKHAIKHPNENRGISTGWTNFDNLLGGIRMKEVTVLSGKTGNGKTTFGMALAGNLIRQNTRCLIISPEMREEKLLLELANNHFRKQVTEDELDIYTENNAGMIKLANVYGAWTSEKRQSLMSLLFDLMEYSIKHHQTKFIFVDHLRLFTSMSEDTERKEIDAFMKKCVRTAMLNDVHIMVVVQPRKLPPGQRKVTGGDLKGSVNIEQDAHNILLMHREENSDLVEFDLEKNRECGLLGNFKLKFDKNSMANYEEIN